MTKHLTLAALALGATLFAGTALAADAMALNAMAPAPAMSPMHPASGGMMAPHKPGKHKPKPTIHGAAMAPASTMAPANSMGGAH